MERLRKTIRASDRVNWIYRRFACCLLHAGFLLGLLFYPEDGGDMFLRNVGRLSANYTALYPRRTLQDN
jgi:hypothetical protein